MNDFERFCKQLDEDYNFEPDLGIDHLERPNRGKGKLLPELRQPPPNSKEKPRAKKQRKEKR